MQIEVAIDLFLEKSSPINLKKDVIKVVDLLQNLKTNVISFSQNENDFLQNSYIEFCGNDEIDILNLSSRYPKAGYFFINRFFENNMENFYRDFALKDKLESCKEVFENNQNSAVEDVIKGESANCVSLYIFMENIARKYEKYTEDRELKIEFKKKIINFYDQLYKILEILSPNLAQKYFDIVFHNHPMMLIELIKNSLSSNSIQSVVTTFSEENKINAGFKDKNEFHVLDQNSLTEFISIIFIENNNLHSFIYNQNNLKILSSTFAKKIENLDDFTKLCTEFASKFKPYPVDVVEFNKQCIYYELFFKFILSYGSSSVSKNTLFIGSFGVEKNKTAREILNIKNIPINRYCIISMHESYKYEDFMDGFVNGEFVNGEFKEICKKAINDKENDYYMIINDINSCDITSIFGESAELLENRYSDKNPAFIRTKNSRIIDKFDNISDFSVVEEEGKSYFAIPENLFIIATLDTNLGYKNTPPSFLKRFKKNYIKCNYQAIVSALEGIENVNNYIKTCERINEILADKTLDDEIEIGHFVFIDIKNYIKDGEISQNSLKDFYENELKSILKSIFAKTLSPRETGDALSTIKNALKQGY